MLLLRSAANKRKAAERLAMQHPTQIVDRERGCEDAQRVSASATCCPSRRTHLDLFSGIGGFALAAQAAGFETIGFAEIDNYASAILKRHWPNVRNYCDVRTVPAIRCDLITGGFPCQPFSVAGKQRGASDDRYLWPAMLDVIKKCKPAWVLGENVAGLVNMELDRCFSDLENLGYEVQPLIIPACATDARHRRDRVWIIGYAKHSGLTPAEIGGSLGTGNDDSATRTEQASEPAGSSEQLPSLANAYRGRFGECEPEAEPLHGTRGTGESNREDASNTLRERSEAGLSKPQQRETRTAGIALNGDSGRPGGYCRWQPEPAICRVANGIPNRVDKLRGLGNAIVPQVAETILKQIARVMDNEKVQTRRD
jgi:DNA (cytosine-5)-methyltransferase 1